MFCKALVEKRDVKAPSRVKIKKEKNWKVILKISQFPLVYNKSIIVRMNTSGKLGEGGDISMELIKWNVILMLTRNMECGMWYWHPLSEDKYFNIRRIEITMCHMPFPPITSIYIALWHSNSLSFLVPSGRLGFGKLGEGLETILIDWLWGKWL